MNTSTSMFIKYMLSQSINLYEIINLVLQDLENSLAFANLKVIIKSGELYRELMIISLEYIESFERIITK